MTLLVGLFDPRSKPVPDMTYNVFSGTLSAAQSINQSLWAVGLKLTILITTLLIMLDECCFSVGKFLHAQQLWDRQYLKMTTVWHNEKWLQEELIIDNSVNIVLSQCVVQTVALWDLRNLKLKLHSFESHKDEIFQVSQCIFVIQTGYVCNFVIARGTRMWANAQPDGRPAEHRWRRLINAAKFGWRPLLDAVQ